MIYTLSKNVILSGNFEYNSMLNKLDVYLLGNRITIDQYNELKSLMDSKQS